MTDHGAVLDASPSTPMPVVAILLAAGESTRMGRPKPLLDWHGRTLIEYQVGELLQAGVDRVIAVLGHRAEEVRPCAEHAGAIVALNPAYHEGKAGSIRTGAEAAPDICRAIVLLNVDQPRTSGMTALLLQEHRRHGNLITVPSYRGRRGHPAILSGSLLAELRAVDEADGGLRAVMGRHRLERSEVTVEDPSVLLDLNNPADYEAARASRRL